MEEEDRKLRIEEMKLMKALVEQIASLNETFKLTNEQRQGYY